MSASLISLWQAVSGALFALVLVAGQTAKASDGGYPLHPVKIIVPFSAGGPLDLTARLIAKSLTSRFNQPFVVENRPGASGNIGVAAVAKAQADGYTLLMTLDTPLTANPALYKDLAFNPSTDFSPIAILASFSQMLVVHPSLPIYSVQDFVGYAKEHKLTYGSGGGKGNPGHLTMEYFCDSVGLHLLHVPYKGNPEIVTDLVGGHIGAGFVATPSVVELVKRGDLRGLAVSSPRRATGASNVPTIAEAGYTDFDIRFGLVLLAPRGIPENVRSALEREVLETLALPETQIVLTQQELQILGFDGDRARTWLHSAALRWERLIGEIKIQAD